MTLVPQTVYSNQFDQRISVYSAQWKEARPFGIIPDLLFWHHSATQDCRADGIANDRRVSWHYSVGMYDQLPTATVSKFMSEQLEVAYTQGYGRLGGYPMNLNKYAISIEMEGPPIAGSVLEQSAMLGADIVIRSWQKGVRIKHFTHASVDPAKNDPACDWTLLMSRVYYHVNRVLFAQNGS